MNDKMFNVGKIVNTHGIRGELKVHRISDFEERFEVGESLFLVMENKDPIEMEIASHRTHKGFDLITFKGFENINDVEHFKGSYLKIEENQLTDLEEDEYYYHEIVGCEVITVDNETLGIIKEILSPGANDVWVVQREKGKDLLIPFIHDVVQEIDIESKKVVIEPIEGLLE